MAETIFAKIIRGELPAQVVYSDERAIAFRDINPVAPVHVLVVPKKEIAMLSQASISDGALLGELLLVAAKVAKQEGLEANGYRVIINNGEGAGQTVAHLHLHVIGGREMFWPPG